MFGIPSRDQVSGLMQRVLAFAAGALAAYPSLAETRYGQVVGAIVGLGVLIWGVKVNTPTALIKSTNAIDGVRGVVTAATAAGYELAAAVPSPTVAAAGTMQAKAIADPRGQSGNI